VTATEGPVFSSPVRSSCGLFLVLVTRPWNTTWKNQLNRWLPQCFRDLIPQALPFLPPPELAVTYSMPQPVKAMPPVQDSCDTNRSPSPKSQDHPLLHCVSCLFHTQRNAFGLSQCYKTQDIPEHDPKEHVTLNDLSDISASSSKAQVPKPFYPYPNQSFFLLGDWFWNGGTLTKLNEAYPL
jgi:hypothetical protein